MSIGSSSSRAGQTPPVRSYLQQDRKRLPSAMPAELAIFERARAAQPFIMPGAATNSLPAQILSRRRALLARQARCRHRATTMPSPFEL